MLIDYTDLQREVVPSDTRNTGHSMDGSGTGRQNTKNIYIRSAHFITDYRGNESQREYLPTAGADNSNLPGMGGVFNTTNLHLYHYANNNPVRYEDPNGRFVINNSNQYILIRTENSGYVVLPPKTIYTGKNVVDSNGKKMRQIEE